MVVVVLVTLRQITYAITRRPRLILGLNRFVSNIVEMDSSMQLMDLRNAMMETLLMETGVHLPVRSNQRTFAIIS